MNHGYFDSLDDEDFDREQTIYETNKLIREVNREVTPLTKEENQVLQRFYHLVKPILKAIRERDMTSAVTLYQGLDPCLKITQQKNFMHLVCPFLDEFDDSFEFVGAIQHGADALFEPDSDGNVPWFMMTQDWRMAIKADHWILQHHHLMNLIIKAESHG